MPYIDQKSRELLQLGTSPKNSGELNYLITSLLNEYTQSKGMSYQTVNDCLGALTGAQLEYYRRLAVPLENEKMSLNGDVYGKTE